MKVVPSSKFTIIYLHILRKLESWRGHKVHQATCFLTSPTQRKVFTYFDFFFFFLKWLFPSTIPQSKLFSRLTISQIPLWKSFITITHPLSDNAMYSKIFSLYLIMQNFKAQRSCRHHLYVNWEKYDIILISYSTHKLYCKCYSNFSIE